jgi:hypothetical protein
MPNAESQRDAEFAEKTRTLTKGLIVQGPVSFVNHGAQSLPDVSLSVTTKVLFFSDSI